MSKLKKIATYGFSLTNHAINRLYERHPGIFDPMMLTAGVPFSEKQKVAYAVLNDAVEDKRALNNTEFMVTLYEKYGYDCTYRFFFNGDVLFLGVIRDRQQLIVTTLIKGAHYNEHLRFAAQPREARFRKKPSVWRNRK